MGPSAGRRPIQALDPAIVEQIAAGEVVDGPEAVVRELLDNALDASARLVQVELRRGGLDLIRVADDGHGLEPDEIELAFAHHTTSKLRSIDDLQRLETLGFRGEALPSIAAAAEVELLTSTGESSTTHALLRAGRVVERGPAGRQPGTTVWVRGLFAGLPARLRFLRGARAEVAAVARRLRWYAVAHPEVRLELIADGHRVFKARGTGRRDLALAEALGEDLTAALVSVGPESIGDYRVAALVSARGVTRPSRQHLALFVNRRRVRVPAIDAAVEAGYRGLLPSGRHPVGAVWIEARPGAVDVNLHPAKEEIRLRDEASLAECVSSLVRGALAGSALEPEALQSVHLAAGATRRQLGEGEPLWELPAETGPPRYLAQLHGALLLCEARNGLYLIDSHRAHEWILYERLRSGEARPTTQGMLEPAVVEVSAAQVTVIESRLDELRLLGLEYERFGETAYRLRAAPFPPAPAESLQLAREALAAAGEQDQYWRDRLLATVACRSAVKKGRGLPVQSAIALVEELFHRGPPTVCPHGSPLMLQLSRPFLRRQFRW